MPQQSSLLYYTPSDKRFLPFLKPFLQGSQTHITADAPLTLIECVMKAKSKGANSIITTNPKILQKLLNQHGEKLPSLNDYAGSIFDYMGIEWLILNPLVRMVTDNEGQFLFKRYLSKITHPESWFKQTDFLWELANESTIANLYDLLLTSDFMAVDIETIKQGRVMDCISYTGFWCNGESWLSKSVVIPLTSTYWLAWVRKLNASPVKKLLQNGKYDSAYFFRFGAPLENWVYDTINLFHCWYSELPKRLDFLASFALRKVQFWKDEGSGTLENRYRYNARDGWATGNAFLSLMRDVPDWAIRNYLMEFPLNFPCHQAEMQGIAINKDVVERLHAEQTAEIARLDKSLNTMLAIPAGKSFNANSWQQVEKVLKVLGEKDPDGTDEIALKKVMFKHPLNTRILNAVLKRRKAVKMAGTYLVLKKFEYVVRGELKYRCLYTINPHSTDTARLASKESQFSWDKDIEWAGLQIHNIPRKKKNIEVKEMFEADEGFFLGEADYEQAESRDTAYLSGDTKLIAAVDDVTKDFHGTNASAFFGVPYDKIMRSYQDNTGRWIHEKLNEELRDDIGKRVNHGANYNMGEQVLADTMGLENVYLAQKMLNLPSYWGVLRITGYLLECFEKAYPTLKGPYYDWIRYCVKTTRQLVSPLGWTRYCFGNPEKNKQDLNSYVAHPSQNLNAGTLNRAWMRVFKDVALKEVKDFRLCTQIHDSILFQYREGRRDLAKRVMECMLFPVTVKDCKGISRELIVPVAVKGESKVWSKIKPIHF